MRALAPKPAPNVGHTSRIRFKRILFATDLEGSSTSAQSYAVVLAKMFGAHLFVLYVQTPGFSPRYQKAFVSGGRWDEARAIAELGDFFRSSQVPFTLLVEPGEVREVLNQVIDNNSIDLVILGTHGRKGLSRALMGSMAEQVSRSSICPVITVGPLARAGFENSLRTIVYVTDFSEESRLALPYAISLAQEFHAELTAMHVAPQHMVRDRVAAEMYLMNRLKSLAPQSNFPWCRLKHRVEFGDAGREILSVAKDQNADLIVMGLHSSVQFTSHFPERLAYSIMCEAACPVMSVLPSPRELKLAKLSAEALVLVGHVN